MKICTNIQYAINSGIVSQVNLTTTPIYTCDEICGQLIPVYGLCQIDLNNGNLNNINNTKYCVKPFIFNDYECICSPGYLLNGTICIHLLSTLTNIDQQIFDNISTVEHNLNNNISNISNKLEDTKDYLYNYFTSEIMIVSDQLRVDLLFVNSTFNSQIQSVTTSLQTINNSLQSQINSNLASLSSLTSQFTSFKTDAINNHSFQNTQIQNLLTTTNTQKIVSDQLRTDLTQSTNSLQTQINSLNSNIQGTNNQVSTISYNLAQTQSLVNLLQNQINSVQISASSGAQTCRISLGFGYCTSLNRCCQMIEEDPVRFSCAHLIVSGFHLIFINECGTFIQA
ncbi:Hypothetical_protein [Hexamita inflata]|uniref:Hypothetical_protein n=1 Tax=Hexamita inflata TaxID=28002 RepID=A0ABP1HC08_9EUKA